MRRNALVLGLLIAGMWPATASAQYVSTARGPVWDRFTLEPYAGRYFDNAGGSGSGFNQAGWLGGVRLGLSVADRIRLLGDVGYAQVDEAQQFGSSANYIVYGSQNWLVTGGVEVDVVPGDTRASLSLLGGAAWRDLQSQQQVGNVAGMLAPNSDNPVRVLVPGFSIRQNIAPRADFKLGVQDYIFVGADPVTHNWALTAGITIR
jgi:hypothetical protein